MFICDNCIHNCGQFKKECLSFERKVTEDELKEINYEIRHQNVNLHKFCRDNNMSYKYFTKALKNKMDMTYKQLFLINNRLNEKDEWVPYIREEIYG